MKFKNWFFLSFSMRDTRVSIALMGSAAFICYLLSHVSENDYHVPLIFVLAVMLVSRLTDGYFYGITASVLAVFFVNFVFTYPYFAFNFTIAGYPLTFITMLGVSVVICTLTTRVKIQEEARFESEKEKMHANLLRAVSHDLRTPLTSIMGSVAAVCENINNLSKERQLELLSEAQKDADWLLRVFENILSITRIGGAMVNIKKEAEAVEEIIASASAKIRKLYPDISIVASVPNDLLLVPMDAILIEQVIVNLLHNAVKHGQHTTEIRILSARENNCAVFCVEDNGVGFSKEYSRGIGLSVCQSIVGAHGGHFTIENKTSGGAVAKFVLPLEEDAT